MTPTTNRLLSALLLLVILGAGVGIGVAADRLWLRPGVSPASSGDRARARRTRDPDIRAARLTKRFQGKLGLDGAQTKAVEAVLKRMFVKTASLRKQRRQEQRRVRDTYRAEIRQVLTPAQRAQFQQMVQAYEKRRRQRRRQRRRRR